MSAQNNQKTAAPSTPAAAPADSPSDVDPKAVAAPAAAADEGADAEDITQSDILTALGQGSDDPKASDDETEGEAETEETSEEADKPEGDEGAAESESDDAESGDDAAEGTGAENETTAPEAEADPAATEDSAAKEATPTQKRINELVARSKGAEEELAKAQERIAYFEAQTQGRLEPEMLESVDSLDGLAKQRRQIVELRQKLMRNPQGFESTVNGKTTSYDAEDVANLLAQTDSLILDAIPAREKWLAENAKQNEIAAQAYPWLTEVRQGPGAQVQEVLQKNPALRRIGPSYKLVAADALIGQTLREAGVQVTPDLVKRLKAEVTKAPASAKKPAAVVTKPVVRKQPPAAPARPGTLPARLSQKQSFSHAADKRLRQGAGDVNDLTASIAARL